MLSILLFAGVVALSAVFYEVANEDLSLKKKIQIITHSPVVEKQLSQYEDIIGSDLEGYRGHIYRVLSYSMHFLKGNETYLPVIATALVYHDLGLWSDKTLSYIEPSCSLAKEKMDEAFSEEEHQLMYDIIFWHHKFTPFEGPHADIVNAVRQADWMDASFGVLSKGMPREHIRAVMSTIPNAGFHQTLLEFGPRLHGSNVVEIVTNLAKIFRF